MATTAPMSGRKAQAARNDKVILEAARAVFVDDPKAPISAVAERAGVGISALYRRYASKEDLLRKLCHDGLLLYVSVAEKALAAGDAGGAPWEVFAQFMRDAVAAETTSLTQALAGTFTPTPELFADATRANELSIELLRRTKAAEVIRDDVTNGDLGLLIEQLNTVHLGGEERTRELRQRYLELILQALQAPASSDLPGQAPSDAELGSRWAPADNPGFQPPGGEWL